MRIATWNVNGLRARLDFVLGWLRERQPDIVGIQELKLEDDQLPLDAFGPLGYQVLSHGQKAWNGVAILSKHPCELVCKGLPGQDALGARLLTARVAGLCFTTVYCPNGKSVDHEDFAKKLVWLDALIEHTRKTRATDCPSVLCGDFNLCPEPIDTWNEAALRGQIFHTDDERRRFAELLESGWVDLFRVRHPELQTFSWWDYRAGCFHKNQGLRIDFVLGSPELAAHIENASIDREYRKKKDGLTPSDHAPVLIELRG